MVALDTNVLVYAFIDTFPHHASCHLLIETLRNRRKPWHLTWSTVYEFLRVVTHPRIVNPPVRWEVAFEFLQALWASSSLLTLTHTDKHRTIMEEVFKEQGKIQGVLFHDSHIAIVLKEHGVDQIVTYDRDFHRFPFIKVFSADEMLSQMKGMDISGQRREK